MISVVFDEVFLLLLHSDCLRCNIMQPLFQPHLFFLTHSLLLGSKGRLLKCAGPTCLWTHPSLPFLSQAGFGRPWLGRWSGSDCENTSSPDSREKLVQKPARLLSLQEFRDSQDKPASERLPSSQRLRVHVRSSRVPEMEKEDEMEKNDVLGDCA